MEAGVRDVVRRILRRVRDPERVEELARKVRNDEDLTLPESRELYRDVDFGDKLPLSKKRNVDVGWNDHAEYRTELRDVDPDDVNEGIRDWLRERLQRKGPDAKKVRMKLPGTGTAVVDYDLRQKPADADVVTVWADGNPYLNTPPTKLRRDMEAEKDPAKRKLMRRALNAWRVTVPGPFRKGEETMGRRGANTMVARSLEAEETADEAYKRLRKDVGALEKRLARALKKHDARQKKEPRSWGWHGNMGHVREELEELVRFVE